MLLQRVAKVLRLSHEKPTFLASNRCWSQVCEIKYWPPSSPPIQSCSYKFWVWSCIASNFDKGGGGDHKRKIMDRPFMPNTVLTVSQNFLEGYPRSAVGQALNRYKPLLANFLKSVRFSRFLNKLERLRHLLHRCYKCQTNHPRQILTALWILTLTDSQLTKEVHKYSLGCCISGMCMLRPAAQSLRVFHRKYSVP